MEEETYKKYIYVSKEVRADLEEVMKEQKIIQVVRFINTYNIENFFRQQLKNLKGITYLILDMQAFEGSKEDEIISSIKLIRQMYDCRIIIIAQGYTQGDTLLGNIFNLGIYNIITAKDDMNFLEQLKKTISPEGMSFGNSMKYQVDFSSINIGTNKTIVRDNYIKVKQLVNVGIVSTEKHSRSYYFGD